MIIRKPKISDLDRVKEILGQWTETAEVEKYLLRIRQELESKTEYGLEFWVAEESGQVIGISGLIQAWPGIRALAISDNPGEIKILYFDDRYRGLGAGRSMVLFLEEEAKRLGYSEIFVRSAARYRDTAHGFYRHLGYQERGQTENGMAVFYKAL